MTIASRTPEGEDNRCPVCSKRLRLEPSRPAGDAPCPHCGALVWFPGAPPNLELHPVPPSEARASERSRSAGSKSSVPLQTSDRVRIREGTFAAMEGQVEAIDPARGVVRVTITVWGRPVPVELEPGQLELVQ